MQENAPVDSASNASRSQGGTTAARLIGLAALLALAVPGIADAYVGPGAGLTVIGTALAFVASILLAIVGFIWYPIKRMWRAITRRADRSQETSSND